MSIPRAQTSDELETVEAQNSLFDLMYDGSARIVASRLGQFVYRRVDSLLSIVEKTARWSLPQVSLVDVVNDDDDDPNKVNFSTPPLIRPLPWILFLPALIALRLLRVSLSFLALMLGQPPVYPMTVVAFLQNKRRKLRALKYRGQRLNRIQRVEAQEEARPTWLSRVILPIQMVTAGKIPHLSKNDNQHSNENQNVVNRDSDDSDASYEENMLNKLKKYADIDADSTFIAADVSDESSDSSISETERSSSEGETTQDAPEAALYAEATINGHATDKSTESPVQPASTKDEAEKPKKPQHKSSLNVIEPSTVIATPVLATVEKAEDALIAENGSSDPASEKQDSKKKLIIPSTKTTIPSLAPEAAPIPNSLSTTSNNSNNSSNNKASASVPAVGEMTKGSLQQQQQQQQQQQPQHKIKQHNPQPANLQSQNNQQPQTITANGGSGGGRKQKRPNQTNS